MKTTPVPTKQDVIGYHRRLRRDAPGCCRPFVGFYSLDSDHPPQAHPDFRGELHTVRRLLAEEIAHVSEESDDDADTLILRQLHIDAGRLMGHWLHRRLMNSHDHDMMEPASELVNFACQCGILGTVFGGCPIHDLER